MSLKLHNTATKKTEEFKPLRAGEARMYNCGPTVYGVQHIGNLSMFVFTDILRRTLEYEGLDVRQVINFTDFGHLSSDADAGEDKMMIGLKREGLEPSLENMRKLGKKYAEMFLDDLTKLNVKMEGTMFPYASEYVKEQIKLIKRLEKKGFAYKTSGGVYFDTSKFSEYGKLGGLSESDSQARVAPNPEKRNQKDFALWFIKELGWDSPWGRGFPGWHIECSAMAIELLGEQLDIHTGGIEHIPVHHNNEIAQSEAATGREPFARYWLHRAHLQLEGAPTSPGLRGARKISKSLGNVIYLSDIVEKGYSPLAFRYFLLLSHYRTPASFSWEALEAAENAYRRLKEYFSTLPHPPTPSPSKEEGVESYIQKFNEAIENDLNTPEALAVVWNLVKDESVSGADKRATLLEFDRVLGLDLEHNEYLDVPEEIVELGNKRHKAKEEKDYDTADKIRQEIEKKGYEIRDIEGTFVIFKK